MDILNTLLLVVVIVFCIILLVAVLFLLPALYVLSCGPAVALGSHGYLSEEAIETAYYPLSLAGECSDWIGNILEWYVELWAG